MDPRSTELKIIVCSTRAEMPTPGVPSKSVTCHVCSVDIWLSLGTRNSAPHGFLPYCHPCALQFLQKDDRGFQLMPRTSEQSREIRASREGFN